MKKLLLSHSLFLIPYFLFSQNIGIGTSSPGAKLHVVSGASGYVGGYFPGIALEGNSHTYFNLLAPNSNETGLLFGKASDAVSGGIVYNNTNTLNGFQFRTNGNLTRMVIDNAGNVGIGTLSPNAPLGFPPVLGKKITLYPGATGDAGMAVQGNLLQIYSDNPSADIAFGYDVSGTITERMRIKGNGNVGIGNNNPAYQLDISNRMRIRSGGNNSVSAGLWLNDNTNNLAAFIGMEDDTYVGIFGIGTGWKFGMNTQTGALKINGTTGAVGQVLQSNGNAAASWGSSTNLLYSKTVTTYASTWVDVVSTAETLIPGLTNSFSVTGNAKVNISFSLDISTPICFSCPPACATFVLKVNGNTVRFFPQSFAVGNISYHIVSATHLLQLGSGTYNIELLVSGGCTPFTVNYSYLGFSASSMIVQIIPE